MLRVLVLVAALALAAPAAASAERICFETPTCDGGSYAAGVQAALDAAEASPGETEVLLGARTFTSSAAPGYAYTPPPGNNPLILVGAGDDTVLTGDEVATGPWDTLAINTAPGVANVVRNLRVRIAENTGGGSSERDGLVLKSGTAENVTVEDRGDGSVGIQADAGTTLRGVDVSMNANASAVLFLGGTGTGVMEDSIVRSARSGVATLGGASAVLRRVDITASYAAVGASDSTMTVEASLLRVTGAPPVAGNNASALVAEASGGTADASIEARHVTAIGPGGGDSDGARARSTAGRTASVVLDSSIVRDFGAALRGIAFNAGSGYAFTTRYSDYPAATNALPPGGTVAEGPGNIDADPLFADPATFKYDLRPGSPAIDAGNPAAPLAPGLDGNGDGTAVPDMGAFEAPAQPVPTTPPPPPVIGPSPDLLAPVLSGLRVVRVIRRVGGRRRVRHRMRFVLSEPASLRVAIDRGRRGRRVGRRCRVTARTGRRCIRWRRARTLVRTAREGARSLLLPARLTPGLYRVTVRPTDAAGNRGASRRARFRVRRPR